VRDAEVESVCVCDVEMERECVALKWSVCGAEMERVGVMLKWSVWR